MCPFLIPSSFGTTRTGTSRSSRGGGHETVLVKFACDADYAAPGCQARPNQEGVYEVLGVGTVLCEGWTNNRAEKGNDRNFISGAWVQGYLTAANVFGDGPSHLAEGTDAEGIMTWIDNYCAAFSCQT